MTAPHLPDSDREQQLNDILLAYVEAIESGEAPDRRQLLDRYPDFADELIEFFASRDQVERLAAPLRSGSGWRGAGGEKRVGGGMNNASPSTLHPPPSSLGELGDFQLIREIGRGGMGVVYEARQISLNRTVALKVLPFAAAFDPKHLQRFKNEAQAAAQLHHSNIVPVYAVGAERGVHYYAMQLIEGQSLSALIAELRQLAYPMGEDRPAEGTHGDSARVYQLLTGQLRSPQRAESPDEKTGPYIPPSSEPEAPSGEATTQALAAMTTERSVKSRRYFHRVARLVHKAAEALEHAHQIGVVHRDIKPANLLVDHHGTLWVTDFGLALYRGDAGLTLTGELLGTLRYMSPEQAMAKRALVDHRTDIYSLGVTLYELLTLEPAFSGSDRQELLQQIAFEEPRPPRKLDRSIPVELETIVLKAIAKNPAERYGTAQELADDLQRFLDDKPIKARRPTLLERATKWSRRHRAVVLSALGGLLVTAAGLLVSTVLIARAYEREHQKAEEARVQRARADEQRDRAEASFRQARQVVDNFTQLCDEGLRDKPGLREFRRKCLEMAKAYYQDFIAQRDDDPLFQEELAASLRRVGNILEELGSRADGWMAMERARRVQVRLVQRHPGDLAYRRDLASIDHRLFALLGCGHFNLLDQKEIREDLRLSADQVQKIQELSERLAAQRRELRDFIPRLTEEERHQKFKELASANGKEVAAILNPGQIQRLEQLGVQSRGPYAFRDPWVAEMLGLSEEQRDKIRTVLNEGHDLMHATRDFVTREGNRQIAQNINEQLRKGATERIVKLLTADQQARWQQLSGTPFRGEFRFGPPPGWDHRPGKPR